MNRITLAAMLLILALPAKAAEWQSYTFAGPTAAPFFAGSAPSGTTGSNKLFGAPAFNSAGVFANNTTTGFTGKLDRIDEKLLLGVQSSSGTMPFALSGTPLRGLDYNATTVKLGYDMGKFTPFVSTSIVSAKPAFGLGTGFASPFETNTNLQNPAFNARTGASVGAGFNYEVTNSFNIRAGVTIGNNPGFGGQ